MKNNISIPSPISKARKNDISDHIKYIIKSGVKDQKK